jgi:hypothetical protein
MVIWVRYSSRFNIEGLGYPGRRYKTSTIGTVIFALFEPKDETVLSRSFFYMRTDTRSNIIVFWYRTAWSMLQIVQ